MPELNHIEIIGHTGSEPEMRFTPTGKPVTSFSLATNRSFTTSDGEKKKETEWFQVVCWNRLAETVNQFVQKGKSVMAIGRIHLHEWDTEQGEHRSRMQINATRVIFLERGERDAGYDLPSEVADSDDNDYLPYDIPF